MGDMDDTQFRLAVIAIVEEHDSCGNDYPEECERYIGEDIRELVESVEAE